MRVMILALQGIPPVGGTEERIWRIARGLLRCGLQVDLHMRIQGSINPPRGLKIVPLPEKVSSIQTVRWLIRVLVDLRGSDVIQVEAFNMLRSLLLCLLLRRFTKLSVLVLHDMYWKSDPRKAGFWHRMEWILQHIAIRLYDVTVLAGEELRDWYRTLHGSLLSRKFVTIPNGSPEVDLKHYDRERLRKKFSLSECDFVAFFFGSMRFEPNKQAVQFIYDVSEYLVESFEQATGKKLLFLLAGEGTEHFARTTNVIPLGFVKNLWEVLALTDVCVIPHLPSFSGPHVKTMYSFAAGKPVISTPDGVKGMLDLSDGVHYLAFDPYAPESLAEALVKLALDRKLYWTLEINGRAYALSHSWQTVAEMYYSLYRSHIKI